jgi:heme A synthase
MSIQTSLPTPALQDDSTRSAKTLYGASTAYGGLIVFAAVMVYLLMVVGGLVRITNSGLGCPDWPLCYGRILPPPEIHAIIEYSHRMVALMASMAMGGALIGAMTLHRRDGWIMGPISMMAALLAVQIPLGGVVVASELHPLMVATHLGLALLILACLLVAAVAATFVPGRDAITRQNRQYLRLLMVTTIATFGLLLSGALVVGSEASYACSGWPLCDGRLIPLAGDSPLISVHLLHRYTVGVVGLLLAASSLLGVRGYAPEGSQWWAGALGVLFVAQVSIGAAQVLSGLPEVLRALHLAAAVAVWAALIVLVTRCWFSLRHS